MGSPAFPERPKDRARSPVSRSPFCCIMFSSRWQKEGIIKRRQAHQPTFKSSAAAAPRSRPLPLLW
jgi:hypothetical protein